MTRLAGEIYGLNVESVEPLITVKHSITTRRIELQVFRAKLAGGQFQDERCGLPMGAIEGHGSIRLRLCITTYRRGTESSRRSQVEDGQTPLHRRWSVAAIADSPLATAVAVGAAGLFPSSSRSKTMQAFETRCTETELSN